MSDLQLPATVSEYLSRRQIHPSRIIALTGDASDRRYFRVVPPGGKSFVLSVHAAAFDYRALPFVNVAKLFAAMPVPVPRIHGEAGDLGVLALEDLGDVTLQARLGAASPEERAALYRQAVAYVEIIQRRGRELSNPDFLPYGVAFDTEKLTWEMNFFVKHFLEAYCGASFSGAAREALDLELSRLVEELAAEPRVLCHRDYHSRNLMLRNGRLYVIDFQDARMGPDTYDLASLLRDSYAYLPESMVTSLIEEYLRLTGRLGEAGRFRERLDVMAVQRNLKALGTFGYQTTARGNPVYVQYIPRTLSYARENLDKYDRFARLRDILAEHSDEFRG